MTFESFEEKIKRYLDNAEYERTHGNLQGCLEFKQLADWLKELKQLREQTRWIPCSERLPEIHQDVILSLRNLDIEIGFRSETEPYFYCHGADGCYIEPQNVLAWMPLPEPYKAEGSDKE